MTLHRVHALGTELLALRHAILELLHAVGAHLLRLLNAIGAHLLTILRLHLLTVRLLTSGHPLLRVHLIAMHLLASGHALLVLRLRVAAASLLLSHAHLTASAALFMRLHRMLRPLHRSEALDMLLLHARHRHLSSHVRRVLLLHARAGESAAATAVALTATAIAVVDESRLGSALAAAMRPRAGRGRDRQCGNARGEKYPGHKISPLERQKRLVGRTVPTIKRMELAF
jgi:hypothetical protein